MKQGLTTQKAEALLSSVVSTTDNLNYDVRMALNFIQNQIAVMPLADEGEILVKCEMSLASIYMMDAVIAKVQVSLDDCLTKSMVSRLMGLWGRRSGQYVDGLVQERRNSIANALDLRLSCTNPSMWDVDLDATVL